MRSPRTATAEPTIIRRGEAFQVADAVATPVVGRIGGLFYAGIQKASPAGPAEISWATERFSRESLAEEEAEDLALGWYNRACDDEEAKRAADEEPSVQIASFGSWNSSDDGLYEAQYLLGILHEAGKSAHYCALQISYQGGDPGEPDWEGPFESRAQAESRAKEALRDWQNSDPEPSTDPDLARH
ncbi:hypothetical protein ACUVZD_000052 [Pseudomonas aeruginosa]